jgi:putative ABC transport system ATP-binding protein
VSSTPLMECRGVVKRYPTGDGFFDVLKNISLQIHEGEYVALMGASGSGKSTLMHVLGCLDSIDEGRYVLQGRDVKSLSTEQLAHVRNTLLGFVFQSFHLLPKTSALENVQLPLLYAGVSAKESVKMAQRALEKVGLAHRMGHQPHQMSGGQQQRVAIARAIVHAPKVVLADEPTGNLDSTTSVEIMRVFHQLWSSGITVVMVTHEHDIAAYASRVLTMKDGGIVSDRAQNPCMPKEVLL